MSKPDNIVRTVRTPGDYAITHKAATRDKRLSNKARGILWTLLCQPDDWETRVSWLVANSADGEHAVRSGLAELRKYGYASLTAERDDRGRISEWAWTIYESPLALQPALLPEPDRDFPQLDYPHVENHHPTKNERTKNDGTNTAPDLSDQGANGTPPREEGQGDCDPRIALMAAPALHYEDARPLFDALEAGQRIGGRRTTPAALVGKVLLARYPKLKRVDYARLGDICKQAQANGFTARDMAMMVQNETAALGDPYDYLYGQTVPATAKRTRSRLPSQGERERARRQPVYQPGQDIYDDQGEAF